jgi:hypothetical protein
LNGQHKLVIDAAQISGVLKEIHFKGWRENMIQLLNS